jgi:hypothetical protein
MSKFDPNQPVTIHNPYPAKLWPYKKGQKVFYISTRLRRDKDHAPISEGRVRWYHPARKQDRGTMITVGSPFVTVDVLNGSDFGGAQCVGLDLVAPHTKAGMAALTRIYIGWWKAEALLARQEADQTEIDAAYEVARLSKEIDRLDPPKKRKKVA